MTTEEKARSLVAEILGAEGSGHGMDHIDRVVKMALEFSKSEKCDEAKVALIALLHDVDDYKLFGESAGKDLPNARKILSELKISSQKQEELINEIKRIGYSKRLDGIEPQTIEGQLVSDADMCEALGVTGIIRSHKYNLKHGGSFFDRNIWPAENDDAESYKARPVSTSVCHMFEKALHLPKYMLTNAGKLEAKKRYNAVISFLYQFFDEQDVPEWKDYLDKFIKNNL